MAPLRGREGGTMYTIWVRWRTGREETHSYREMSWAQQWADYYRGLGAQVTQSWQEPSGYGPEDRIIGI